MIVGVFDVEAAGHHPELGPKWRVKNQINGIVHFTYGLEAQVTRALERASAAWAQKLKPRQTRAGQGRGGRFQGRTWNNAPFPGPKG